VVKVKEDALVFHDIRKLDIKKIQDRLKVAQDDVLQLDNKKNQYELSMAEREKEISVHRCVLTAEFKAAELERHKIAVQLADRQNKVRNLKIKYESLIQRKQGSSSTNVNEHSQAYYMIRAAQEKEELQRKEDELKAKILKNEKELKALVNTLSHLKNRNSNYRDYFINKGATQKDVELKNHLDEQCKVAADNLMRKKKEFEKMKKECDEIANRIGEMNNKKEILDAQKRTATDSIVKFTRELNDQKGKSQRAANLVNKAADKIKRQNIDFGENSSEYFVAQNEIHKNLTKTMHSIIFSLKQDYPEVSSIIDPYFREVEIPAQPPSTIDVRSEVSQAGSERSHASMSNK